MGEMDGVSVGVFVKSCTLHCCFVKHVSPLGHLSSGQCASTAHRALSHDFPQKRKFIGYIFNKNVIRLFVSISAHIKEVSENKHTLQAELTSVLIVGALVVGSAVLGAGLGANPASL